MEWFTLRRETSALRNCPPGEKTADQPEEPDGQWRLTSECHSLN